MRRPASLLTGKSSDWQGTEYETYCLSKKEWVLYGGQGVLCLALLSYIFYRSGWIFLLFLPAAFCYPLLVRRELKERRKEQLTIQFKDAILAVSSALNAGYSVENAFGKALEEVERIHGEDSMMAEEIRLMLHKVRMNRTFEEAFADFSQRSGLEDVRSFADVFLAARRSGGELMKIIARTAEIIAEKIRIQEDIMTATAAKRLEQRVMAIIPILIVFYMDITSPGFFDVLYETSVGRIIMTICLIIYAAVCCMAKRCLEIRV